MRPYSRENSTTHARVDDIILQLAHAIVRVRILTKILHFGSPPQAENFRKFKLPKCPKNTKNQGFLGPPQAENFEKFGHSWVLPPLVSDNP